MSSTQATVSNASKYVKSAIWDTQANRYMQPKVNDRGLKTVTVISTQKNKKLHIQLPSMTSWGISDYTDPNSGESDGKFSIKLHFSGKGNLSEESQTALDKLRAFEQQVLSDAVTNSEAWFGKKQTREIVEFSYFPFLKAGKNSETKQPDPEKGVYFRPKVNCYSGKWDVEVFDPEGTPLFPTEDEAMSPIDFVPSGSQVTCGIECKHIWIGAKGWGISWSLKQCVVIPKLIENTTGKLMLDLSDQEKSAMYTAPVVTAPEPEEELQPSTDVPTTQAKEQVDTYVENSDNEDAGDDTAAVEEESTPEPAVPAPAPVKKTVVKKAAPAAAPPAAPAEEAAPAAAPAKKKVVRKKT